MPSKPLVIFGLGDVADIAFTYFSNDSDYRVVAYTVDAAYQGRQTFHDLPVVPYDSLRTHYDPAEVALFVGVGYGDNNRVRDNLIARMHDDGWTLASYVASRANIWSASIADNCMVIDTTTLLPGAKIGSGTILWTNTVIGEYACVGASCYIGPTSFIGGYANIGDRSVVGPLAHVASYRTVGDTSFVGASARVYSDVPAGSVLLEPGSKPQPYTSDSLPPMLRDRLYQANFKRRGEH